METDDSAEKRSIAVSVSPLFSDPIAYDFAKIVANNAAAASMSVAESSLGQIASAVRHKLGRSVTETPVSQSHLLSILQAHHDIKPLKSSYTDRSLAAVYDGSTDPLGAEELTYFKVLSKATWTYGDWPGKPINHYKGESLEELTRKMAGKQGSLGDKWKWHVLFSGIDTYISVLPCTEGQKSKLLSGVALLAGTEGAISLLDSESSAIPQ